MTIITLTICESSIGAKASLCKIKLSIVFIDRVYYVDIWRGTALSPTKESEKYEQKCE